jgi:hypothetical protein
MFHENRVWSVGPVASPEQLAEKLTDQTWTLCTGFYVAGHDNILFLNDSTHEDGAGEFAVVKAKIGDTEGVQIESITFSWCSRDQALSFIWQALSGEMDKDHDFAHLVELRTVPSVGHRCRFCE